VTSVSRAPNRQEGDRVRLKTFRAFTLAEALDAVHEDLGTGAAILHTRTFKRGGFLGLGGREVVEVIASEQRPETTILPSAVRETESASNAVEDRADTPSRQIAGARARAAYGAA
jgi:flagellar biosynthesis protein FlhF